MNPFLDQLLVASAVLGAALYLLGPLFKSKGRKSCGGGCCSGSVMPDTGVPKKNHS